MTVEEAIEALKMGSDRVKTDVYNELLLAAHKNLIPETGKPIVIERSIETIDTFLVEQSTHNEHSDTFRQHVKAAIQILGLLQAKNSVKTLTQCLKVKQSDDIRYVICYSLQTLASTDNIPEANKRDIVKVLVGILDYTLTKEWENQRITEDIFWTQKRSIYTLEHLNATKALLGLLWSENGEIGFDARMALRRLTSNKHIPALDKSAVIQRMQKILDSEIDQWLNDDDYDIDKWACLSDDIMDDCQYAIAILHNINAAAALARNINHGPDKQRLIAAEALFSLCWNNVPESEKADVIPEILSFIDHWHYKYAEYKEEVKRKSYDQNEDGEEEEEEEEEEDEENAITRMAYFAHNSAINCLRTMQAAGALANRLESGTGICPKSTCDALKKTLFHIKTIYGQEWQNTTKALKGLLNHSLVNERANGIPSDEVINYKIMAIDILEILKAPVALVAGLEVGPDRIRHTICRSLYNLASQEFAAEQDRFAIIHALRGVLDNSFVKDWNIGILSDDAIDAKIMATKALKHLHSPKSLIVGLDIGPDSIRNVICTALCNLAELKNIPEQDQNIIIHALSGMLDNTLVREWGTGILSQNAIDAKIMATNALKILHAPKSLVVGLDVGPESIRRAICIALCDLAKLNIISEQDRDVVIHALKGILDNSLVRKWDTGFLSKNDIDAKSYAAAALEILQAGAAIKILLPTLAGGRDSECNAACHALALLARNKSIPESEKSSVILALEHVIDHTPIQMHSDVLASEDITSAKISAVEALGSLQSIQSAIRCLHDSPLGLREAACESLSRWACDSTASQKEKSILIPTLQGILDNSLIKEWNACKLSDFPIRIKSNALQALKKMQVAGALVAGIHAGPDSIRLEICKALYTLAKDNHISEADRKEVIQSLKGVLDNSLLNDPHESISNGIITEMKLLAVETLEKLHSGEAIVAALQAGPANIRIKACHALDNLAKNNLILKNEKPGIVFAIYNELIHDNFDDKFIAIRTLNFLQDTDVLVDCILEASGPTFESALRQLYLLGHSKNRRYFQQKEKDALVKVLGDIVNRQFFNEATTNAPSSAAKNHAVGAIKWLRG